MTWVCFGIVGVAIGRAREESFGALADLDQDLAEVSGRDRRRSPARACRRRRAPRSPHPVVTRFHCNHRLARQRAITAARAPRSASGDARHRRERPGSRRRTSRASPGPSPSRGGARQRRRPGLGDGGERRVVGDHVRRHALVAGDARAPLAERREDRVAVVAGPRRADARHRRAAEVADAARRPRTVEEEPALLAARLRGRASRGDPPTTARGGRARG